MKTNYYYLLLGAVCLFSCEPTQRLMERGLYDQALKRSMSRLKSKRIKQRNLDYFESVFNTIQNKHLNTIYHYQQIGQPEAWPSIHEELVQLHELQERITSTLAHLKALGYKPEIELTQTDQQIARAAEQSAKYYYEEALPLLVVARMGDAYAAREAYDLLIQSRKYQVQLPQSSTYLEEALQLGKHHIAIIFEPENQEEEKWFARLSEQKSFPHQQGWNVYYARATVDLIPHYRLHLRWKEPFVSGDETSSSTCFNSKEIEDGYTIKKEWSAKDSAFVDVKEVKYKTVSATVETVEQVKSASINIGYRVVNVSSSKIEKSGDIYGSYGWSNEYSEESGDSEALDGTCSTTVGFCWMFPNDDEMLNHAVDNAVWRFFLWLKKADY